MTIWRGECQIVGGVHFHRRWPSPPVGANPPRQISLAGTSPLTDIPPPPCPDFLPEIESLTIQSFPSTSGGGVLQASKAAAPRSKEQQRVNRQGQEAGGGEAQAALLAYHSRSGHSSRGTSPPNHPRATLHLRSTTSETSVANEGTQG